MSVSGMLELAESQLNPASNTALEGAANLG
jgi:hypothetical protein